ncbi:RNA polymerase sigma factor SigZ [Salinibacillus xinjiangensis]|uniref:RNA polymerase sigma factor SigZ n=1 Tax=Salinibacillus xinjiangensis TaxID=1229268 RepID=A0A6G1XB47_9BACI|nr:RNA polymerase sigma factor SigZ [Salinibacillus xinjiangensis]MRG88126.1 RNA polymerase sigma factor SigZ [Salinibacillus xinjiangensis]
MEQLHFEDIWQSLREPLKQFIKSRLSNEQDAEDIIQEVFIKIHNHLPNLKEEEKLQAWVYQITRNTLIDFYRCRNTQKNIFEESKKETIRTFNDQHTEENINELVSSWLKDLTSRLPEKYQEALSLVEFQQISQKELASRLGLSPSGAKSRVQRGREKLKKALLECCHLEFDYAGNIIDYRINRGNCACAKT